MARKSQARTDAEARYEELIDFASRKAMIGSLGEAAQAVADADAAAEEARRQYAQLWDEVVSAGAATADELTKLGFSKDSNVRAARQRKARPPRRPPASAAQTPPAAADADSDAAALNHTPATV